MADDTTPTNVADTVKAVAEAVTGPGTPDAVSAVAREDRLTLWMRNLAGPALCAIIVLVIGVLSNLQTLVKVAPLWTELSEVVRVHYVGGIGVALAIMVGLLIWRMVAGKATRIEVKAGPGSFVLEGEGSSDRPPPRD